MVPSPPENDKFSIIQNYELFYIQQNISTTFCCKNQRVHSCPCPRCGRSGGIADAHLFIYIYTSILKLKYELWKYNSDTSVSAFAMTISRRKSHLTSPSAAYFSTFATKTLLKSSAISKISLTLSMATMAMVVCRRLIASLLMSNGYARQPILRSPKPRQPQRGGRGATGEGWTWQRAQRREPPALQVLQNVFSWQGG